MGLDLVQCVCVVCCVGCGLCVVCCVGCVLCWGVGSEGVGVWGVWEWGACSKCFLGSRT